VKTVKKSAVHVDEQRFDLRSEIAFINNLGLGKWTDPEEPHTKPRTPWPKQPMNRKMRLRYYAETVQERRLGFDGQPMLSNVREILLAHIDEVLEGL
jgi:hypothetical protein